MTSKETPCLKETCELFSVLGVKAINTLAV